MSLPALHHGADTRSITERVNVLIREYNSQQRLVPAGTVLPFAGPVAPAGFLLCHGQAVSRADYAALFAAIGTTHGAGNGSTTFNVPDLRGRVPAGKDDMGGAAAGRLTAAGSGVAGATLGAAGGAETHTLTAAQMPAHAHAISDPGHRHGADGIALFATISSGDAAWVTINGGSTYQLYYRGQSSLAATGITVQSAGSGSAHNNAQPTITLNYVIAT